MLKLIPNLSPTTDAGPTCLGPTSWSTPSATLFPGLELTIKGEGRGGGAHSSSTPANAMFHSFLSSNGDGSLHHPVSSSVAHGLLPLPSPSPPHTSGCYLHRSSSTHSLAFHHRHLLKSIDAPPQPAYSSSPSSSSCDRLNFNASPVRRVVSTGDLQVAKASIFLRLHPSSSHFGWFLAPQNRIFDNRGCMACTRAPGSGDTAPRRGRKGSRDTGASVTRGTSTRRSPFVSIDPSFRFPPINEWVCYYFILHLGFQYACRKTLADGRPRVRGRFVRNGETETEVETETEAAAGNSLECFSYGNDEQNQSRSMGGEWSSQLQAALETDEEHEDYYDEELLASFADVFSMDILS
ncbi:hypothetical protein B296_00042449 [Ensete ventricosum]|uniref:CCT domain-containing protein n=1 Tax=Ensete ventricosum TaxID=4639 RepID=A0A426XY23_ENSVE|nr:hypothetical protein B296_00042449 [Ensete ventricosum]